MNGAMQILSLFDSTKRVLVVGELIIEKYLHGTYDKVTTDNMPVFCVEREESHLSGSGNIVNNLTAMGLNVDHISIVGHNDKFILDLIKQQSNVDAHEIITSQNYSVKKITRYFSNHRQCFWTADDRGIENFEETIDLQTLISDKLETNTYSMIVISDSRQKILSASVVQKLLSEANRREIPTIADIDTVNNNELFCGFSYIQVELEEFVHTSEKLLDMSVRCKQLFDQLKTKAAIIVFFKQGLALYSPDRFQVIPIPGYKHTVDLCGTGDTLLAATVFGIVHNWPLDETCNFASICVGNVMQKFGLATVSMIDVIPQIVVRTRKELQSLKHFIPLDATVVLTTGCFDMIHTGHVESLRQAKELGNFLIVALNSDVSVKSYKGEKRPIIPLEQRCSMLQATKYVDFIVIFDEPRPTWIVEILNPDIFVKGAEYSEERIRNHFPSLRKICFTPQITSTTTIIGKIKNI